MTALCAIAVFGASLSHLVASPELYGDPFQAYFDRRRRARVPAGQPGQRARPRPGGRPDHAVTAPAITVGHARRAGARHRAVRGPVLLSTADGRLPAGDHEIALGVATMRDAGTHIGDTRAGDRDVPGRRPRAASFRVVGTLPLPADVGTGGLGTGAALTAARDLAAQCPPSGPSALRRCHSRRRGPPAGRGSRAHRARPRGRPPRWPATPAQNPDNLATPTVPRRW